jgi:pimeloyl-ACP methyl ester carboxylesterase
MPVLNLTVTDTDIRTATGEASLDRRLTRAAAAGGPRDPIVLLIHGFRYSPLRGPANPHDSLYAVTPDGLRRPRRQTSWPTALGFRDADSDPGLCLPIGWDGRGTFAEAFAQAETVGHRLAGLIARLHARYPDRPIKLMGHSLGGRVALAALGALPAPMVRQVILLAPADFDSHAEAVLTRPGAQGAEILQISPPENWLFDRLLEHALRRHPTPGTALGRRPPEAENWIALNLANEAELANLAALGHAIGPRCAPVCHWGAYLREGVMDLYSALLTDRGPRALRDLVPPRRAT